VGLTAAVLAPRYAPLHLGLLFAPELAGAVITSIVLFEVFTTRGIHYFVLAGMIFLTAGVLMLREVIPPSSALTLAGSGLNGVGIGASVTPALFLAAFSLRSAGLQRVFAVLELLRAVAAFLVAPVLLHFAVTLAGLPTAAMGTALWICFALSAGGALAGVALYLLGGVRPSAPKVQPWRDHVGSAWPSPPLLAAVRPGPARRAIGEESTRVGSGPGGGDRPAAARASRRRPVRGRRPGPVVFGYDGSELARAAIAEAGHQLPAHRDALVVTVWSMLNVEFVPEPGTHFDSACADEVRQAAEQTAARGAALAKAAGFHAQAIAVEGTPTWKAIADTADNYDASLIVLACRGHRGLSGHLVGSVARDVAAHSRRPVLIEREHRGASTFVPGRPRPAARGRRNELLAHQLTELGRDRAQASLTGGGLWAPSRAAALAMVSYRTASAICLS